MTYFLIAIFAFDFGGNIFVESRGTCKSVELQDKNGIILHWSETPVGETRHPSPYCVDKNEILMQRKCMESGFWEEFEPEKCLFYALNTFTSCPYGMEKVQLNDDELCIKVMPATKWKNSCIDLGGTQNVLDLSEDKLKEILNFLMNEKKLSNFWLPAKRYRDYNPYQWQLAGENWGETVDFSDYKFEVEDNYKDNCLTLAIRENGFELKSEDCEREIPEVCIYDESSVVKLACKDGLTSRYSYHQNKCFSVERLTKLPTRNLFQATKLHSRKFMKDLMETFDLDRDDRCLVDFGINSENYFTNSSFGGFTVINSDGKWMMSNTFTCAIYEETIDMQVPEIYLKFDEQSGKLLMIIYSEEFLWKDEDDDSGAKCFTIADNELVKEAKIKQRIWSKTIKKCNTKLFDGKKSHDVTKSIYELEVYGSGPGVYWCAGHAIKSFELIKSNQIITRKKLNGVVFAVALESKVKVNKNVEVYDKKFLKSLTKSIKDLLSRSNELSEREKMIVNHIQDIRVMKIENFDKVPALLTAIYHVTVWKKIEVSSEELNDFMEKYADKFDSFDDSKVFATHLLMESLEEIFKKAGGTANRFLWINSTEYCLPSKIDNPNPLTSILEWKQANLGETLPPTELCVYRSGMPLARKCEGDFINGGRWQTLTTQQLQCVDKEILTLHTKRLFAFDKVINPNETHGIIGNMTSISSHYEQLIPADIFYISKAVQQITNVANVTQGSNLNSTDLDDKYNLTIILNNIMNVNDSFIQLSQLKLNTTNILLDSYDNLINSLATNYSIHDAMNNKLISSLNETDGTFVMHTEKIVVFICDPQRANVSGMALVKRQEGETSSLLDYKIEKLYATQTIDDISSIYQQNLEIASYVPDELLNSIDEIHRVEGSTSTEPLKIVVKVFYNDAIFKSSSPVSSYMSQSKIISVSIPGHDQNLPRPLPIMFKKSSDDESSDNDVCGYWEFQPNGTLSDSSEWLQQGCQFVGTSKYDKNLALCECSHLTHFAYLIMGNFIHDITPDDDVIVTQFSGHQGALNIITLLGSTLSILGIIGIFITAFCFRAWREKASSKVLLQLSLAILLQMTLFSFFSTEKYRYTIDTETEKRACIALGSSLHYSVLVTFSWMLITAFLQFKRYVIVLGSLKPDRFFLKSFIVGWGFPLIPIVVVLAIDPYLYIPKEYGICYPQGLAFIFSVLLPVGIIVLANLIVFIFVIYSILKIGSNKPGNVARCEHSMTPSQLRVSIFLFFLLGLTWIFGLMAASQASIIFSYLFCLTATIQGFVLFLYFIVLDPITRKLWRESFRSWKN